MVKINLLPWRDDLKAHQNKMVRRLLIISVLVAIILICCTHFFLSQQTVILKNRITQAEKAAQVQFGKEKDKQKNKYHVTAMGAINKIKQEQSMITKLFSELAQSSNEDVCFTEITHSKNSFFFVGRSRSAAELTHFLNHWRAAYLFAEIKIDQLERQEDHFMQFRFQAVET